MSGAPQGKKKSMSREDAAELYEDLRKALAQRKAGGPSSKAGANPVAKQIAAEISKAMSGDKKSGPAPKITQTRTAIPTPSYSFDNESIPQQRNRGAAAAVGLVILCGAVRLSLGVLEALGITNVASAEAAINNKPQVIIQQQSQFGKEEMKVLTSLDSRRAELADKSKQVEERERQLDNRDREFAVRVAQLKELTDLLKNEREKNDKKHSGQIEQLANVYGSMSPQEAAQLMEQLDVQIALSLIEKMPEKKIGQILALMSKERALTLTKMLSGKSQG